MTSDSAFDQLIEAPIFIVGAPRSGTTWVQNILTTHPQVAGVIESWLFTPDKGLGSLFTPAHWPAKYSGLGRLLERDDVLAYARDAAQQIMAHAIGPEHRFLVEKSPSHVFAMKLIAEIFPGARFIHVLRDGRDVCVSIRAAANSWAPAWQTTFGRSVAAAAKAWQDVVICARQDGRESGDHFLEIRYETLHADPMAGYRRLFDFCHIPYDEELLQSIFEKTDFKKNYEGSETAFRRGGRTGDWQTHFSLIDAWLFNRVAGETLVESGYEEKRSWWRRLFRER